MVNGTEQSAQTQESPAADDSGECSILVSFQARHWAHGPIGELSIDPMSIRQVQQLRPDGFFANGSKDTETEITYQVGDSTSAFITPLDHAQVMELIAKAVRARRQMT